jgi:hypothetical protein
MHPEHQLSAFKTWSLVLAMVGIVLFQGWLAYTVIGDLGMPDWDYRPVPDVYGESPYAMYPPVPYPQHVRGTQGQESYPLQTLTIQGAK